MAVDGGDLRANLILNIKKFLQSIRQATTETENMANDIDSSLEDVSEQTESSFKGMGKVATVFGASLATVGGAIGASLLAMTNNFKDSEKSLNKFGAQTGITGKELDGFKNKIEDTYLKGYGEDIQEVSDTYSKFQRELKLSADETENLTEKAFQLRDVFGYEVEDSLRATSSLIKQFGVDGEDAYDLIAVTAQRAGDRADDLLDTVDEYSKDFSKAGYSADEMFNLLIGGIDAGIRNFDVIGDTVKEFGNVLLQSGDDGIEVMKQVTGSTKKAKQVMKDLSNGTLSVEDALKMTVDGLSEMDDNVKQNQIGASLFGSLWEEAGLKGLQAMLSADKATEDYKGTLENANETLKGQNKTMEQVKREFEQVTNLVGEELAPILSKVLSVGSKVILKLLEFGKANPILIKIIAIGGSVIAILGSIAGAIISVAGLFAEGGLLYSGVTLLGTLFTSIGGIIASVLGVIISWPVLIGVAIVALVALIIWKWDEVKAFTINVWTAIVDFITGVPETITNLWNLFIINMIIIWQNLKTKTLEIWNGLLSFIKSIPGIIFNFFTSTLPEIVGFILGTWVKMQITFYQKAYQFFTVTIPNLVKTFWQFVKNLFTQYIPQLIAKLGIFIVNAHNKFKQMKTNLLNRAKEILSGVLKWFNQLPGKILRLGSKLYSNARTLGEKMWNGLKNQVKNIPKNLKKIITDAISGVGKLGSIAYSSLKGIGKSMWNGFKKGLGISSPSYIEKAMFAIQDEGENMQRNLFNTFRKVRKLPQVNSLAELTKRQAQYGSGTNEDNRTTQNFNAPLVQISGDDSTTGKRTAYSLYDQITFNKRAMGVK
jgi:TP901 family phage tail tape measure protein